LDQQLKDIGRVPNILAELDQTDISRLNPTQVYNYLKELETYRRVSSKVNQVEGELFYKIREKISQLEAQLYPLVFNVPPLGDKKERIKKFNILKKQYQLCRSCVEETDKELVLIQQSIDDEIRTELFAIQNQQLKYRKCFSDIQLNALVNLDKKYPNQDSLSQLEKALYQSYFYKIKNLENVAIQFQQIEKVSIEKLPSHQLPTTLSTYQSVLADFKNEACQLYYGEILDKKLLDCLGGTCRVEIP
jgi:ribosomal protein L7Ae-like RNA K-turn-binding protein